MNNHPELIVMLTWHDYTVTDAAQVFEQCKDSAARYWGFKEHPLSLQQMQQLFARMRQCGKTTLLEVVAYTETEGLAAVHHAAQCHCDIVMGTKYSDTIRDYCHSHGLRYMPFVGTVTGRPSVLTGTVDDIVAEARSLVDKGVDGIDLLAYRYVGDVPALMRAVTSAVDVPVVMAGSIDSHERLDQVCQSGAWAFTIGSAFFEHRFGESFGQQVDAVCRYVGGTGEV